MILKNISRFREGFYEFVNGDKCPENDSQKRIGYVYSNGNGIEIEFYDGVKLPVMSYNSPIQQISEMLSAKTIDDKVVNCVMRAQIDLVSRRRISALSGKKNSIGEFIRRKRKQLQAS